LKRASAVLFLALLALCPGVAVGAPSPSHDNAFREGWSLLEREKYPEARAAFAAIPPAGYDLGDYVLYFSGMSAAHEGKRADAVEAARALSETFPGSPLVPYMQHELAFAAAVDNDLPAAREAFAISRGKVTGNGRKAEEGYVAGLLAAESGPNAAAAALHLDNFAAHGAQEAATLSFERLWQWRTEGRFREWELPVDFFSKFARATARAGEIERARSVYEEAVSRFQPSDDYYAMVLEFAEFHRKQGETAEAAALLSKYLADATPAFLSEVRFLQARVDWKAGRLDAARKGFLEIADGAARKGTADRARYLAAWIMEDAGDLAAATEEFGRLIGSADDSTRQEALFRRAYGLFRQKRYDEAIPAFAAGEKGGFGTVENARHRFWRARSLREAGKTAEADALFRNLSGDAFAGAYALFASKEMGGSPFRILDAPSSGETKACGEERERLWAKVRGAEWGPADAEKVRRAERLTLLGVIDYAVLEASLVDRVAARKAIGMGNGGAAGLFRYLAGDLKGGIRETSNVPLDPASPGLVDRIQYPLAPEFLADCDRKRSGIDPLVLHAVIRQESRFQADALSSAGAVGLMQLMPRTAAETARKEKLPKPRKKDLTRPALNVRLGAAYLSRLVKGYGGDYVRAVAAYNAGETAVAKWWDGSQGDLASFLERISYKETRFYVRRVFLNLLQYYRIYRPEMFARHFPSAPAEATPVPDVSPPPETAGPADNVLSTPPTPEAAPTAAPPAPAPDGK
jgi:tetratricopeptide (TPR) repeat protein